MQSRFIRQSFVKTGTQPLLENNLFTFSGLNLVDPDEISNNFESPYAVNFRIFAPKDNTKRVAISKRNGYAKYSIPVGETVDTVQTSVTGASDKTITTSTWLAMPFTASSASRLSKVELNLENDNSGTGPVIVNIYTSVAGAPGVLLASSSVPASSITGTDQYLEARFINAPLLATSTTYWIVAYVQSDGTNNYIWTSTTSVSTALTSSNSGGTWSATAYGLNFKIYLATDGYVKGLHRYYNTTQSPAQLFAFGTVLYSVNDSTGAVTSIKTGLNSSATAYRFMTVNNKEYYVNGVDVPQVWDGTTNAVVGGSPGVSNDIILHANRAWYKSVSDPNHYYFSDAAAYETFQNVSFIYIPSPNTADPTLRGIPFQNNLVFFTRNRKWVLYGTDLASFVLRESPAKKGATCDTAIATDGNFIYFLSDDGVYKHNGGTDIIISKKIEPLLANMASKTDVKISIFDNKLYMYYRPTGQASKLDVLIYDIVYDQWLHDTNVNIEDASNWISQTDTRRQLTGSSLMGQLMYGETGTSDLGKGIAFEYRTKYFSFGHPAAKHRIKRLYPHLRGQSGNYSVNVSIDADQQNAPVNNVVPLGTNLYTYGQSGLKWGTVANGGSGATYGSSVLSLPRLTVGGNNRLHQVRLLQSGVNNPVDFLGLSMYVTQQRPS